ncbi:FAD-binding oxidoreductase [Aspergillus stella-maris]|uniref:FAD-binding oxidoreductase n=1 Tax=Aspergillus stella-maris TaxID=1810926 RepID=UPI003CCE22CD
MRNLASLEIITLAGLVSAIGQGASAATSLSDATTTVSSSATPFAGEAVQLTDDDLASIQNKSIANLFQFSNESATASALKTTQHSCKLMPGDDGWPSEVAWEVFNLLVGGSLIKPAPLAAVCYPDWPEYDADACSTITTDWITSDVHMNDPTSIMLPLYEGRTCMAPGYNYTSTCEQGGYPTYVVNVTTVAQIQLAVNLARNMNLRLVVKNTGHDFNGKAAGKGALSIWTHWLKDKEFYPEYTADNGYVGPAIKVGAGIQVFEANEFAKENGVTVVAGEAVTVGLAGYTAGGGHSPLSSMYGLAADQVLSMEVVLASGQFITASATQNPDVFWMLRGGGGSTIGVVTSMTIRAHPQLQTTSVTFNFTIDDCPSADAFWSGVSSYFDNFETFVDAGTYGYYYVGASAFQIGTDYPGSTDYYFRMESFIAPNMTVAETKTLLAPWFNVLDSLNITYTPWYNHADNYHDVWEVAFPQEYVGTALVKTASRLMPRSVFTDDTSRDSLSTAHKDGVDKGLFFAGFHVSGTGTSMPTPTDTSVLPAWRSALAHIIVGTQWTSDAPWSTIYDNSTFVTSWMDTMRAIAPDSGSYMSEGDLIEPNQTEAFYGEPYARLYELKQRFDPTGVFFALTGVGAVDWEVRTVDGVPNSWNNNGRLCPVSA